MRKKEMCYKLLEIAKEEILRYQPKAIIPKNNINFVIITKMNEIATVEYDYIEGEGIIGDITIKISRKYLNDVAYLYHAILHELIHITALDFFIYCTNIREALTELTTLYIIRKTSKRYDWCHITKISYMEFIQNLIGICKDNEISLTGITKVYLDAKENHNELRFLNRYEIEIQE